MIERSHVTLDAGLKSQLSARAQDSDPMIADRTGKNNYITWFCVRAADTDTVADHTHS